MNISLSEKIETIVLSRTNGTMGDYIAPEEIKFTPELNPNKAFFNAKAKSQGYTLFGGAFTEKREFIVYRQVDNLDLPMYLIYCVDWACYARSMDQYFTLTDFVKYEI